VSYRHGRPYVVGPAHVIPATWLDYTAFGLVLIGIVGMVAHFWIKITRAWHGRRAPSPQASWWSVSMSFGASGHPHSHVPSARTSCWHS
jgi:hypothetical protein